MQVLQNLADTLQHPAVNNPITQTIGGTAAVAATVSGAETFGHVLIAAVVSTVAQVLIKFLPSLLSKLLTKKNENSFNN